MPLLTDHLNLGTIYFRDKTYPPEVIQQNIDAVAECLNNRTVSNSPFVYLFAPNHIKMVYALFGIIKSGKICVLVDPAIGKLELAEMMADTVPGVLIRIDKSADAFDFEKEFEFRDCRLGEKRLEGLDDVCLIIYTAAMDGYAKGAMLTTTSLLTNAKMIIDAIGVTKDSVSNSPVALHHLFALQSSVIAPLLVGGSVLITSIIAPGQIRALVNDLEKLQVTHFHGIPLVYYLLAKIPDLKTKVKSVRVFISGGYKLSRKVYDHFYTKSGKEILEGYGLTETSLAITCHLPGDDVRIESVGKVLPGGKIRIMNSENSEVLRGEKGEICFKGAGMIKGYFNNNAYTRSTITDGWFHTGDEGYMDPDGYLYLTGMKKNMLNIGGNKVFPAEVERLMKMHENVLAVKVSGKTELNQISVLGAKVKLRRNSHEAQKKLVEWCRKNMTKYKVPGDVELV